jgi:hypothetical protein
MVGMIMTKSEEDIHMPKNIEDHNLFSITDLLNLCEDQNSLLKEEDRQIERFVAQISGYEQELYEKDVYIKKLEDEVRQASHRKGEVQ